ncbi:hypothetical protein Cgig2_012193 [Carnegiea gigantea]|uniref:F-box/LRR-repeat protein 15-like leucin rich repeat domain-containing protein n=1 Tax=Carnegiea gigantea TaxID=171969 RepID=A0A9Q1KRU5_9CARY|nr:hypothetical protein Cgig2_012193 [Carnegiea gigantea]
MPRKRENQPGKERQRLRRPKAQQILGELPVTVSGALAFTNRGGTRWGRCSSSLENVEILNLNGCQKISDRGIEAIASACLNLRVFSIYWNVRYNLSDKSMQLIADTYQELESLNITRCIKVSDQGLQFVLRKCSLLQSLNLYALSSLTDDAYKSISLLGRLRFLDLCGAQNLSDQGVACVAICRNLASLNLTWCVRVTDVGVISIAEGCTSLELLSLFGIVGVTDKSLEALARSCSKTLKTLDVNGCVNIKPLSAIASTLIHDLVNLHPQKRSRDDLLQLFPHLVCFKVHS